MSLDRNNFDIERLSQFLQGQPEIEMENLDAIKLKIENEALENDLKKVKEELRALEKLSSLPTSSECERLFHSGNVDIEEVETHFKELEKQVHFLEVSNKMFASSMDASRSQMGQLFHDFSKKCDEVKALKTSLKILQQCEGPRQDFKVDDDEELFRSMRKEIESLKAQKEDIVNHSKNSETMFTERIVNLTADMERLMRRDLLQLKADEANELIKKLEKQLQETQESLKIKDVSNQLLEQKLSHATDLKELAQQQSEYNQMLVANYWEDRHVFTNERKEYQFTIASLNEEVKGLEEMATQLRAKFEDATEKLDKQTITFSNEKAKFCHDLERVEEKWNAEVCKLNKKCSTLIKSKQDDFQRFNELKREDDEVIAQLRNEVLQLKTQLEDAEGANQNTIDEWDAECAQFEEEIYALIDERRTESKKMATLKRKNMWLSRSIKQLAEQRRDDIAAMKDEIATITERCDLLRKEKVDWLTDLKREVNEWKDEASSRVELEQKIEELEKEKAELEEKVENVTEKWRSECEAYEVTMALFHEDRVRDMEENREKMQYKAMESEKLAEVISSLTAVNGELTMKMESQKLSHMEILQQTVRASQDALNGLKIKIELQRSLAEEENRKTTNLLRKKVIELEKNLELERKKLAEAYQTIGDCNLRIRNAARARTSLVSELNELKRTNQKLCENMGVEELDDSKSSSDEATVEEVLENASDDSDDSDSDDSDCDSDEPCTCGMCETDDDNESIYEDMPKLRDEREPKEAKKTEAKEAEKEPKKEPEEWEVVDDDEPNEDGW